jgi:hypothetical protein
MQASRLVVAEVGKAQRKKLHSLEAELGCRIVPLRQEARLAKLTRDQYIRLQVLERERGVALVAFESVDRLRLARPSEEQLRRLQALERELGFVLIAYALERGEAVLAFAEKGARLARLSKQQAAKLRQLEDETDLVFMAYQG